jgi:sodium transport system permease protein
MFVNTYLFPVPRDLVEAFGDVMLGADLPLWQMIFFLTVLPGVLEELTFRGVLLHGLRARLGPVPAVLAIGAIFGLFHVSLFRIVPTAYLGGLLAAVVLLTGSIFPAMVWHTLNNALALVPAHRGWVDVNTELPGWSVYVGLLGLGVCFAMLWQFRRPYPDPVAARAARRASSRPREQLTRRAS